MKRTLDQKGFTLIELLVVITIIAILASIAVPAYNGISRQADRAKATSNLKQIDLALVTYATDNGGFYPGSRVANGGTGDTVGTAGDAWGILIRDGYLEDETMFYVKGEFGSSGRLLPPDEDITTPLEESNVGWAYTNGLTDSDPPVTPLAGTRGGPSYSGYPGANAGQVPGSVWGNTVLILQLSHSVTPYRVISGDAHLGNDASNPTISEQLDTVDNATWVDAGGTSFASGQDS
jgi:prepilin-type N-terminal cleavage/methylation domain-containing protein